MEAQSVSQGELARRVGMTQPAIYALLRKNKTGSKNLHKIARALGTTPAYLSGETDDPHADAPPPPVLSAEEAEWLEILRALPPKDREAVLHIGRSMNGMVLPSRQVAPTSPTLHDRRKDYRAEKNGEEEHT